MKTKVNRTRHAAMHPWLTQSSASAGPQSPGHCQRAGLLRVSAALLSSSQSGTHLNKWCTSWTHSGCQNAIHGGNLDHSRSGPGENYTRIWTTAGSGLCPVLCHAICQLNNDYLGTLRAAMVNAAMEPQMLDQGRPGKEKALVFQQLQPVCSLLLKHRADAASLGGDLQRLQHLLAAAEPVGLAGCMDYVLFPLLFGADSIVAKRKQGKYLPGLCHRPALCC